MKLKKILEEMGATGITRIQSNLDNIAKEMRVSGTWIVKQKDGATIIILKNGKPFATIPLMKAMNREYLKSILKKEAA